MIELAGFKGYYLDIESFRIFSSHTKDFLKPKYDGKRKVFILYRNGTPNSVSLFDILRGNFSSIAKKLK